MIKQNIAHYIINDLSRSRMPEEISVNSSVISEIVEGWNRNIYVEPNHRVKINRQRPEKYILM